MKPRALVVRSGATAFVSPERPVGIEIVEKESHRIDRVLSGEEELARPSGLAIFTSRIAVGRILEPELRERFEWALAGGRIAAVGAATAAALRSRGVEPDIVAEGSGASVLRRLPPDLGGCRVLLPRGEDATKELPEELARRGAEVACLVLYRKVPQPHDAGLEREILEKPFGVFCATSPSAARWLFDGLGRAATARLRATPAAVLGRSTARFLEGRGVARVSVAPEATFGAVTRLLESLAAGNPRE